MPPKKESPFAEALSTAWVILFSKAKSLSVGTISSLVHSYRHHHGISYESVNPD